MRPLRWYFDFVSPFAYLQTARFAELPTGASVEPVPVLLAGLLGHWSTKGPAEIPEMRRFTYRYVTWYAARHGIPFRLPPAHPFNPLRALRLAVALGARPDVVLAIFRHIWGEGREVESDAGFDALVVRLGAGAAAARGADPAVKTALRENTEAAAAAGVFGVPTFDADGVLFWGNDATDMLIDYLRDPVGFESEEMRRVSALPVGSARRGV